MSQLLALEWNDSEARLVVAASRGNRVVIEQAFSVPLDSAPGEGTTVRALFKLSHPDRKPLGDIVATLGAIVAGRPELELVFEYTRDGQVIASLDGSRPPE